MKMKKIYVYIIIVIIIITIIIIYLFNVLFVVIACFVDFVIKCQVN